MKSDLLVIPKPEITFDMHRIADSINNHTKLAQQMRQVMLTVLTRGKIYGDINPIAPISELYRLGILGIHAIGMEVCYRITELGLRIRPLLRLGASASPKWNIGDLVTLCPFKYSETIWDNVFVIQLCNDQHYRITDPDKYWRLGRANVACYPQKILYEDMRHITVDEINSRRSPLEK